MRQEEGFNHQAETKPTDPDGKTNGDAQDRCFRLNVELLTLPQNKNDEDLMNSVLWNYLMKSYSNDESKVIEAPSPWIFVAANTRLFNEEEVEQNFQSTGVTSRSRQQTYPKDGKQELVHPWMGEPLYDYRGDLLYPQTLTYYKFPQLCVWCLGNRKKALDGDFWNNRLESICPVETCYNLWKYPFICVFSAEPRFIARGLCKDSVMDTQYKFADHKPGPTGWGKGEYRSYVGPKGWVISRNKTDRRWRMTHLIFIRWLPERSYIVKGP